LYGSSRIVFVQPENANGLWMKSVETASKVDSDLDPRP
jgi:hypothetical protein